MFGRKKFHLVLSIFFIFFSTVLPANATEPMLGIVVGAASFLIGGPFSFWNFKRSFIEERDNFPRSRYSLISFAQNNSDIEHQPLDVENGDSRPKFTGTCGLTYFYLISAIGLYAMGSALSAKGFAGL